VFSITAQIILWLIAALIAVPLISVLGLDRPKGADDHLSPLERERAFINRMRKAFEFLGAIGGAMGILYLMQRGMRSESNHLAYALGVLLLWSVGLIIALVAIFVIGHFLRGGVRTVFFLVMYGFFLFGFLLPLLHDKGVTQARIDAHKQATDDYAAAKMRLRTSWTADLRSAGAHGGEGVVPPMLEVIDSGQGVQVTNIGSETLCLDLRRSHAKLGAGLDYQCALWSEYGSFHSCVEYTPGHKQWLRLASQRPDLPDCSGQPLEFRVGDWEKAGPGWWSDAALEDFDQLTARLATEKTLYLSVISAPDGIWKSEVIAEAAGSMYAIPVGPPRVRAWRELIAAAQATRPSEPGPPSEARAMQAAHLNQVRELEAQLRAINYLRDRQKIDRRRHGEFPDYLPIEDNLDTVTVRHTLGAVFYVNLARVGLAADGREFVCEMRGTSQGNSAGTYVSASQPGQFVVANRAGQCAKLGGTRIEMVAYDFNGRLTLATDSALDRLQARAEARLQSLQSNPGGSDLPQVELSP